MGQLYMLLIVVSKLDPLVNNKLNLKHHWCGSLDNCLSSVHTRDKNKNTVLSHSHSEQFRELVA